MSFFIFKPLCMQVKGGADEDGYLQGQLDGRTGFIPGNMVEEITDPDDIAQVKVTLSAHAKRRTRRNQKTVNGHGKESGSSKKMRALFDYDPERDSPNESSEVELTFTEGDILTVFGSPDEDGFYKVSWRAHVLSRAMCVCVHFHVGGV